ncbi:MAG: thymidylate synthase ThyX [Kiritimatiellae bacterium]|nr:thymidylate synthase ThyX [Kiritimatiellia bacterium]
MKFLKVLGTWRDVADAARTTIRQDGGTGEPSARWKKLILLAEHSPVRKLLVNWKWSNLPYWVSVHFVRHKFGIEHFVSTQRTDRTGEDRTGARQDAPVEHECFANAAEIMFISRRRLCMQASPETRAAWKLVLEELSKTEPELASCCVRECVYRGFCPEFKCCGFVHTASYAGELAEYRKIPEKKAR